MPWVLILVVAGLIVYFVTSYATLGVVLVGIGAGLFLIQLVFFAIAAIFIKKQHNKFEREWDSFGSLRSQRRTSRRRSF